jgi:hypothetical protein
MSEKIQETPVNTMGFEVRPLPDFSKEKIREAFNIWLKSMGKEVPLKNLALSPSEEVKKQAAWTNLSEEAGLTVDELFFLGLESIGSGLLQLEDSSKLPLLIPTFKAGVLVHGNKPIRLVSLGKMGLSDKVSNRLKDYIDAHSI